MWTNRPCLEFTKPPRLNKSPAQLRHSCISNASLLRRLYNFVNKSPSRPEAKGKPLLDCRKGYAEFPGCAGFSSRFLFVHTCHRALRRIKLWLLRYDDSARSSSQST